MAWRMTSCTSGSSDVLASRRWMSSSRYAIETSCSRSMARRRSRVSSSRGSFRYRARSLASVASNSSTTRAGSRRAAITVERRPGKRWKSSRLPPIVANPEPAAGSPDLDAADTLELTVTDDPSGVVEKPLLAVGIALAKRVSDEADRRPRPSPKASEVVHVERGTAVEVHEDPLPMRLERAESRSGDPGATQVDGPQVDAGDVSQIVVADVRVVEIQIS